MPGQTFDSLIKKKSKGIGWGQLAHSLGIHPSELNKARVALKKQNKSSHSVGTVSLDHKASSSSHGNGVGKSKVKNKDNPGKGKGKAKGKIK